MAQNFLYFCPYCSKFLVPDTIPNQTKEFFENYKDVQTVVIQQACANCVK